MTSIIYPVYWSYLMHAKFDKLPVDAIRDEFAQACAGSSRIILSAPTGSGKSTRIPCFLADILPPGAGAVICVQPRRLAARLLARRVAAERGVELGGEIGYRVRFDQRAGATTKIIYETDGILLREMRHDPQLRRASAIVFDEFHERRLAGDILLGLILDLQERLRPDLKIVVMSAGMDTEQLAEFLMPCKKIHAEGRTFPVDIRYHAPDHTRHAAPIRCQSPASPRVW